MEKLQLGLFAISIIGFGFVSIVCFAKLVMSPMRNDLFKKLIEVGYIVQIKIFDIDDTPTIGVVEWNAQKYYVKVAHKSTVRRNDVIEGYFHPDHKFALECIARGEVEKDPEEPKRIKWIILWIVSFVVAGLITMLPALLQLAE